MDLNQSDDERNNFSEVDDETDMWFVMQAYEYKQRLQEEQNLPRLTHNPINRDREDSEIRLMGDYFDDHCIESCEETLIVCTGNEKTIQSWQGQYGRADKKYLTIMLEVVASQNLGIRELSNIQSTFFTSISQGSICTCFPDLRKFGLLFPRIRRTSLRGNPPLSASPFLPLQRLISTGAMDVFASTSFLPVRFLFHRSTRYAAENTWILSVEDRTIMLEAVASQNFGIWIRRIMYSCIIMHNMILEVQKMAFDDWNDMYANPSRNMQRTWIERCDVQRRKVKEIRDKEVHLRLQRNLKEHIWQNREDGDE
ncbi:hypothetical protein Tco_0010135 [Tanacetum coccineum]